MKLLPPSARAATLRADVSAHRAIFTNPGPRGRNAAGYRRPDGRCVARRALALYLPPRAGSAMHHPWMALHGAHDLLHRCTAACIAAASTRLGAPR